MEKGASRRWRGLLILLCLSALAPAPRRAANPMVSRSKPVLGSDGEDHSALVDGIYGPSRPGVSWPPDRLPAWVAIRIGSGPSRLLFSWSSPGNTNYTGTTGAPIDYSIEVSPNSTNGSDGTWKTAVGITGNYVRAREHSLDFSGNQWVRLTVARAPGGVVLDEIDVHDISSGASDTWFFMGDSITDLAFDRTPARQPGFATQINQSFPAFFPAMIDGGIYGELSADGVRRIDAWLALNPDVLYWAIGYGTNDSGRKVDPEAFRSNLQTMVSRIKSAGRIPMIARIPRPTAPGYSTIPSLNEKIDEVAAANGLLPGPDLYTWFSNTPGQIGPDGIHPTDAGAVSMNRLWAQAVSSLYATPPPAADPPAPPPDPVPPVSSPSTVPPRKERTCGLVGLEALTLLGLVALGRKKRAPAFRPGPRISSSE